MKPLLAVVLIALSLPSWWRTTNSHAASARGARAYAESQFAEAEGAYAEAQNLAPSSRNSFNLGTAQVAAGHREQGSATLAAAMKDPALRADALFNRGNSALAAKAYDYAVRDYIDALRANPGHAAAKRNLEIALQRRESQRRQSSNSGNQGPQGNQQQPQPAPPKQGQKPKEGDLDLEALLRSVQQQEQEELKRMRGRPAEGRVGW